MSVPENRKWSPAGNRKKEMSDEKKEMSARESGQTSLDSHSVR